MSTRNAEEDLEYAALMTNRQFHALCTKLDKKRLIQELKNTVPLRKIRKGKNYDREIVKGRLLNGWNTEYLLILTKDLLTDQLIHAIHWAFPQAYYSTYNLILAYFLSAGHQERHHSSVIKKVGQLMLDGKYPPSISFLAIGGGKKIRFIGVDKMQGIKPLSYNPLDSCSVENQICQFLKSTREISLSSYRNEKEVKRMFLKKNKTPKQHLNAIEWETISERMGPTSILNLLYRKRIKANYMEIDTLLTKHLDPEELYSCLIHIVSCCNFVHECFVSAAVGINEYRVLKDSAEGEKYNFVKKRFETIEAIDKHIHAS